MATRPFRDAVLAWRGEASAHGGQQRRKLKRGFEERLCVQAGQTLHEHVCWQLTDHVDVAFTAGLVAVVAVFAFALHLHTNTACQRVLTRLCAWPATCRSVRVKECRHMSLRWHALLSSEVHQTGAPALTCGRSQLNFRSCWQVKGRLVSKTDYMAVAEYEV